MRTPACRSGAAHIGLGELDGACGSQDGAHTHSDKRDDTPGDSNQYRRVILTDQGSSICRDERCLPLSRCPATSALQLMGALEVPRFGEMPREGELKCAMAIESSPRTVWGSKTHSGARNASTERQYRRPTYLGWSLVRHGVVSSVSRNPPVDRFLVSLIVGNGCPHGLQWQSMPLSDALYIAIFHEESGDKNPYWDAIGKNPGFVGTGPARPVLNPAGDELVRQRLRTHLGLPLSCSGID